MLIDDRKITNLKELTIYNGCNNCKNQIGPLRMCEWAERGGDGLVHIICPKWEVSRNEDSNCV